MKTDDTCQRDDILYFQYCFNSLFRLFVKLQAGLHLSDVDSCLFNDNSWVASVINSSVVRVKYLRVGGLPYTGLVLWDNVFPLVTRWWCTFQNLRYTWGKTSCSPLVIWCSNQPHLCYNLITEALGWSEAELRHTENPFVRVFCVCIQFCYTAWLQCTVLR